MLLIKIIIIIFIFLIIIHSWQNIKVNNNLEILQIHKPKKNLLEENFNKKSPLIITGLMDDWTFTQKLQPTYLKKNFPDINVKFISSIVEQEQTKFITKSIKDYCHWLDNLSEIEKTQPLKNFIENRKINIYCSENNNFLKKIDLLEDIKEQTKIINTPLSLFNTYPIWFGHSHSKTGLHYDCDYRNVLCQIKGYKKIYLFPPNQTEFMYPSSKFDHGAVCSEVDFWNIDQKKFPKFNQAKYIEIKLSPGQIISIPPYWWHAVENIDTNVALSIRSEPIFNFLVQLPNAIKLFLHNFNLYKNTNCTCCES